MSQSRVKNLMKMAFEALLKRSVVTHVALNTSSIYDKLSTTQTDNTSPLDDKLLFDQLFSYIKKNTFIPNFLSSIAQDEDKLSKVAELYAAIKIGNAEAEVFKDPHCYLYLLYLIQEEKISFWQGMTVYTYIMALMQFTNQQSLNETSPQILAEKMKNNLYVESLAKNGKLTVLGEEYINGTILKLNDISVNITYTELANYILKLPSTELWLLKAQCVEHISYFGGDENRRYNKIMTALILNIPFIHFTSSQILVKSPPIITYWAPSLTLVNFLLEKISPSSIKILPIFGAIGTDKLTELHAKGKHIAALYAPDVKSNLVNIHGTHPGPFTVFWHDIGHALWGSMLQSSERKLIFDGYIPQLKAIQQVANKSKDTASYLTISNEIHRLNDFDLTPIKSFSTKADRFSDYVIIRSHFESTSNLFSWQDRQDFSYDPAIGDKPNDKIVFLMFQHSYSQPNPEESLKMWRVLLLDIYKSRRNSQIFTALETLAVNAVTPKRLNSNVANEDVRSLYLDIWLELLNSDLTSEQIWEKIRSPEFKSGWGWSVSTCLQQSLIPLIVKCNLTFFHPYLPLTKEKRLEFKELIQNLEQIQNNRIEKSYDGTESRLRM